MFCVRKFVGSHEIEGGVQSLSGKISHKSEVHSIKQEYDRDGA